MSARALVAERLRAVTARLRSAAVLRGAADLLAAAVIFLAACYLMDRFLDFRRPTRLFLSAAFVAGTVWLLVRRVLHPLLMEMEVRRIARLVENLEPAFDGALVTVVEVAEPAGVVELLGREVHERLSVLPAGMLVDGRKVLRSVVSALIAVALAAAFVLTSPGQARAFLARFTGSDVPYPVKPAIGLDIPSHLRVAEGSDVYVKARALNGYSFRRLVLEVKDGAERTLLMKPAGDGVFEAVLKDVHGVLEVAARAGGKSSAVHVIEAVPRPELRSLVLEVTPPAYTGREPYRLMEGQGNASVLAGSGISFVLEATKPLTAAFLAFPDGSKKGMTVDGTRAVTEIEVKRDVDCTFELLDEEGFSSRSLPSCHITAVPDKPPLITVESPKANRRITPNGAFRLRCRLRDDFGVVSAALLLACPEDGRKKRIPLDFRRGADVEIEEIVSIADLKLDPGRTVQVRIEAADASPAGVKTLSEAVTLRVSRPYEILDELQSFLVAAKQRLKAFIAEEDAVMSSLGGGSKRRLLARQSRVVRDVAAMAPDFAAAADDFRLNRLGEEEAQLLESVARALDEGCAGLGRRSVSALSVLASAPDAGEAERKAAASAVARFRRLLARHLERLKKFENYSELTRQIKEMMDKEREIRDMLKRLLERSLGR